MFKLGSVLHKAQLKTNTSIRCLHIQSDRSVTFPILVKRGLYARSEKDRIAWGLSPSLLKIYEGEPIQIISDESCAPIHGPHEAPWQSVPLSRVIDSFYDAEKQKIERNARRDTFAQSIKIMVLAFSTLLIVLVVAGLLQSGRLSI